MVQITILNGNLCELDGDRKILVKLYNKFRIKHPEAWHIKMYNRTRWDGYVKYISEYGKFKIGLLPKIYNTLQEWGQRVKIIDRRPPLNYVAEVPKCLGNITLYPRQIKALERLLFNKVGKTPFLIEAGNFSVGFGKSLLFAAIHQAFNRKLKTILLLNDADLFNQFKREIPPLLPGEDIRFIQGSQAKFGNFNVAMVQSVSRNLKKYQGELLNIDITLIDEADIIDNKTYQRVIEHLWNSRVRIGLSGTLYMSKLKKDLVHNMNIMSFIGEKVDEVKLVEQMKHGRATPVVVKMVDTGIKSNGYLDYLTEYNKVVAENREAYAVSFSRALFNARYNRFPMLIVTKFIEHCEQLYEYYKKHAPKSWRIEFVHHETKKRKDILERFRTGGIDILIATTIIARGKNFPTLKYLQNTSSMDSNEKSIQILGRLVRQHESKRVGFLDDLVFPGRYLARHGRHRDRYYRNENLKLLRVERRGGSWRLKKQARGRKRKKKEKV